MMRNKVAVGLICGVLAAGVAQGQVQQGLEYSITPFLWGSALNGNVQMGAVGGEVDASISDVLDAADLVVPIHFEAKGPVWTLLAEVNYAALSQDLADMSGASGELEVDMLIAELLSGYEIGRFTDLLFGIRYVSLDNTLSFSGAAVPVAQGRRFSAKQDWVDPVVGIRYAGPIGRRWSFSLRVDAGGFGLGSDLTWNVRSGFGVELSEVTSILLGWHYFDTDYDDKQFVYDMTQSGPEIGFRFKF